MTKRIPNSSAVNRAFRNVRAELRNALTRVNRVAAKAMAKGDYAGAEALAARGRAVHAFAEQVLELQVHWRTLASGSAGGTRGAGSERTALWEYYQPILRVLRDAGGSARRNELEPLVEKVMAGCLKPADRERMSGGVERWRVMVRRSRKHLAAEGWIAKRAGPVWRITPAGSSAADQEGSPAPP